MTRPGFLLIGWLMATALAADESRIVIGSKGFTESVILGEIVRLAAPLELDIEHHPQLGGSRILYEALRRGEIDLYPEYSGTLMLELMPAANLTELRSQLAKQGLLLSQPLGFDNTYALGLRRERAAKLGLTRISDLKNHPDLGFAFSNEFMQREDGWPGLQAHYQLPQTSVQGIDHDLAYRALEGGNIDVMDVYSTDADIQYYDLVLLEDDQRYFPEYQAHILYRQDLSVRAPGMLAAIADLEGRIDAPAMTRLNAAVKLDGRSEADVAAGFLGKQSAVMGPNRSQRLMLRTGEHLTLVIISLTAAILVAIPLGVAGWRKPALGQALLSIASVLQTIPSLALFVFLIPLLGIGAKPAIAALFLYSLLPILRNTHSGLSGIPHELSESARALGLGWRFRLWQIDLPLARPSIMAGIKTAAVINVGTATLGALIGAGGYGQPILTGIRLDDIVLILEGAIPAAVMALAIQFGFEMLERRMQIRGDA